MEGRFINPEQEKYLQDYGWDVTIQPAFITLYAEDFDRFDVWQGICGHLGVSEYEPSVKILYIGVQ